MGEDGSVGSEGVVDLCEDLLEGCGGPAEGVSDLIPLGDEVEDSPLEGSQVGEVGGPESLASENAEPLLHGVHPGTVDRGEMGDKARMGCDPLPDELAVMDRDVVREQVDRGDRGGDGLV